MYEKRCELQWLIGWLIGWLTITHMSCGFTSRLLAWLLLQSTTDKLTHDEVIQPKKKQFSLVSYWLIETQKDSSVVHGTLCCVCIPCIICITYYMPVIRDILLILFTVPGVCTWKLIEIGFKMLSVSTVALNCAIISQL